MRGGLGRGRLRETGVVGTRRRMDPGASTDGSCGRFLTEDNWARDSSAATPAWLSL